MENKYYTPSIEEFHYGFEFESNAQIAPFETKWFKQIFNEKHDTLLKYHNEVPEFQRVKYLDKEDIESLGWKFQEDMYRPVEYIGHNDSTNEITIFKLNKFLLRITNSNYNKIEILGNGNFSKNTFYGTIKNKFELKVLMKQLDIV